MSRRCAAIVAIITSLLAAISWTDAAKISSSDPYADLAAADMVRLPGHVLPALAKATVLAPMDKKAAEAWANEPLTLTIVLKRSDQKGFEGYLHQVYDPHSPLFHHYLAQHEIADRFGPSQSDYYAVVSFLRANGFVITHGSENRLTIEARGTHAIAERAFEIRIDDYQLGKRKFFANDRDPALPAQLNPKVQAVIGLSDLSRPHSTTKAIRLAQCEILASLCWLGTTGGTNAQDAAKARVLNACRIAVNNNAAFNMGPLWDLFCGASQPPPTPTPSTALERPAENPQTDPAPRPWNGLDGTGQTIGLVEFDNYQTSDVQDYLALVDEPASLINNLSEVNVDGGTVAGPNQDEVLLDIDTTLTMASGAKTVVYDAPFNAPGASFQAIFNQMLTDKVTIISNSWAYCENETSLADAQSIDSIFQNAAAAGITVFNGSGDDGSTCLDGRANTVSVPADSPSATAVGGSSESPSAGLMYGPESWWNGATATPPTGQGGFGTSKFFPAATYQVPLSGSAMRSVPDVVMNADPARGVYICQASAGGCPTGLQYGGTSLAAPEWAAMTALLNQGQGTNLGFLNPHLYPLANTSAFHDAAALGSDFAHVGLGSPNLNLIYLALTGQSAGIPSAKLSQIGESMPVPPSGILSAGVPADGVTPLSVMVALRDANGNSVSGKTVTLFAGSGSSAVITPSSALTSSANGVANFSVTDRTPENLKFTATDHSDGIVITQTYQVPFVTPPATSAGLDAFPSSVTANGMNTSTITVTLKDQLGRPSPGKVVTLSQDGHSIIKGPSPAVTDASGQIQFTAVDQVDENVTYSASDVTDGSLPFPATAMVSFISGPNNGCGTANPVAALGFQVTPFATGFLQRSFFFQGLSAGCAGAFGMAFDASGNLFVSDQPTGNIYKFPPGGGVAGPGTLLTHTAIGPSVIGLMVDKKGNLYAGRNATTGALATGVILQIDPTTGDTLREIASGLTCPALIALDPLSGDLFADDNCSGDGLNNPALWRISSPDSASPKTTVYATLPTTPDGTEAFAPDGTQYVLLGDSQVAEVSATNGPSPATVSVVPSFTIGTLGLLANGTRPGGGAQTLIGNFAANDNVPGGVGIYDLTISPPSLSTTLLTDNSDMVGLIQGPDGCVYGAQGDAVFKITDNTGACKYAPATQPATLTLTPTNLSPNPAQGTSRTFTASFHYTTEPEGTPIFFQVNGANPQSMRVRSNASGQAAFSYTAAFPGIDTIVATSTLGTTNFRSNSAVITWTAGQHTSFLTLNLSPASVMVGKPVTLVGSLSDVSVTPAVAVVGASVEFTLEGNSCFGTTDAKGNASCSLTPTVPEIGPLTTNFSGNSTLIPATATVGFNVTAPPTTIPTFTPRPTGTATATPLPTPSETLVPTATSTAKPTPTRTVVPPTATPTPLPTHTPALTPTSTRTSIVTKTPTPSSTPTVTTVAPTATPTITPSSTPTVVAAATDFSAPGGRLTGAPGQQVKASFTAANKTGGAETIRSVTLSLSNPGLFSSLNLSAGHQSSEAVTPPEASNTFAFSPPLTLAAGASLTFTVTATIAAHPAMSAQNGGGVVYATMFPLSAVIPDAATLPLFGSLTLLGLGLMLWPAGRRRRLVSGASLLVILAAGQVGCSGGGNSTHTVTVSSTVTVTAVNASGADGATSGLPLKVATISSTAKVDP